MSDLFKGQTMTEAFKFITGGAEHTFTFGFQPDKVTFYNLTAWTSTAAKLPIITWFRDQTTAAYAYQHNVIDSSAGASFNFIQAAANGFTVADTGGGQGSAFSLISAVTAADPCVVTTTAAHGLQTNQLIRITDLGSDMPTARGMDQLNNNKYRVVVIDSTSFSLKDPISDEAIDSTAYTAWVAGGRVTLLTHVITPNNPVSGSYTANAFEYDPIVYKLTCGTGVMGTDGDVYLIEAIKFGQVTDLGDIGA